MGIKEHDKMVRQQCKSIQYSNKILKHLAPLWELRLNNWHTLLTKQHHTNKHYTLHIPHTHTRSWLDYQTETKQAPKPLSEPP